MHLLQIVSSSAVSGLSHEGVLLQHLPHPRPTAPQDKSQGDRSVQHAHHRANGWYDATYTISNYFICTGNNDLYMYRN